MYNFALEKPPSSSPEVELGPPGLPQETMEFIYSKVYKLWCDDLYRVGGVVSGPDFVDRAELLNELIRELPKNNFILTGPRRVGKTSLLEELKRRLSEKLMVVNLDITTVHPLGKSNFLKHLGREILGAYTSSTGKRKLRITLGMKIDDFMDAIKRLRVDVEDWAAIYLAESPDLTDLAKRTFDLAEQLAEDSGRDYLIMLDEVPKLIRMKGGVPYQEDVDFMWTLRGHMHKKRRSHFIITGSAVGLVERLYRPGDSPFHGTFLTRQVAGIDGESAEKLVRRMEKFVKIDDRLVRRWWTGQTAGPSTSRRSRGPQRSSPSRNRRGRSSWRTLRKSKGAR